MENVRVRKGLKSHLGKLEACAGEGSLEKNRTLRRMKQPSVITTLRGLEYAGTQYFQGPRVPRLNIYIHGLDLTASLIAFAPIPRFQGYLSTHFN